MEFTLALEFTFSSQLLNKIINNLNTEHIVLPKSHNHLIIFEPTYRTAMLTDLILSILFYHPLHFLFLSNSHFHLNYSSFIQKFLLYFQIICNI